MQSVHTPTVWRTESVDPGRADVEQTDGIAGAGPDLLDVRVDDGEAALDGGMLGVVVALQLWPVAELTQTRATHVPVTRHHAASLQVWQTAAHTIGSIIMMIEVSVGGIVRRICIVSFHYHVANLTITMNWIKLRSCTLVTAQLKYIGHW